MAYALSDEMKIVDLG